MKNIAYLFIASLFLVSCGSKKDGSNAKVEAEIGIEIGNKAPGFNLLNQDAERHETVPNTLIAKVWTLCYPVCDFSQVNFCSGFNF